MSILEYVVFCVLQLVCTFGGCLVAVVAVDVLKARAAIKNMEAFQAQLEKLSMAKPQTEAPKP